MSKVDYYKHEEAFLVFLISILHHLQIKPN